MTKHYVEVYNSVEPLRTDWERLARETRSEPFLWPGWVAAWWGAYSEGQLQILAAYRDGRLVGVLPLRRSGEVLSATEDEQEPLYGLLVVDDAAARQVLEALFSQKARRIDLTLVDPGAATLPLVQASADAAGYRMLTRSTQKVPYVDISATTWEAYESGLPRRSSIRRRERQLEESGRLVLEIFDGTQWLEELLDEGFRVEGSGWKGAAGTSIDSNPAMRRFYTEAARWAAREGWLRLAFLRFDGRTLAFDYCFEYNDIHYMLKIGYDPAYGKYSPGMILRKHMLARAFSKGFSAYELLGGYEPWKREWSNAYHELRPLHLFVQEGGEDRWYYQLYLATQELAEVIPSGEAFVLVDEDNLQLDLGGGRRSIPFVERCGSYWGPPPDDETAIGELQRLRETGAEFVVFGWPAFWWLGYYAELRRYLYSHYECVLQNERLLVFKRKEW